MIILYVVEATKTHKLKSATGLEVSVIKGEIYLVGKISDRIYSWSDIVSTDYYEFKRYKPVEYNEAGEYIKKTFLVKYIWYRPFKKLREDLVSILFKRTK